MIDDTKNDNTPPAAGPCGCCHAGLPCPCCSVHAPSSAPNADQAITLHALLDDLVEAAGALLAPGNDRELANMVAHLELRIGHALRLLILRAKLAASYAQARGDDGYFVEAVEFDRLLAAFTGSAP